MVIDICKYTLLSKSLLALTWQMYGSVPYKRYGAVPYGTGTVRCSIKYSYRTDTVRYRSIRYRTVPVLRYGTVRYMIRQGTVTYRAGPYHKLITILYRTVRYGTGMVPSVHTVSLSTVRYRTVPNYFRYGTGTVHQVPYSAIDD